MLNDLLGLTVQSNKIRTIVHLSNEACELHLLLLCLSKSVRAVKWHEVASVEVTRQFVYAEADGSHSKSRLGSMITGGPPKYYVTVINTQQPRSVILSSESKVFRRLSTRPTRGIA